jgi:hypothetical protein
VRVKPWSSGHLGIRLQGLNTQLCLCCLTQTPTLLWCVTKWGRGGGGGR